MSFRRLVFQPWLAFCVGLALSTGCSVKRVPSGDPAVTNTNSSKPPYDFQGEQASPPPPAVDATPSGAAAAPTLDTPAPVQLDDPSVQVQDLPAPAAPPAAAATASPASASASAAPGAAGYRVQVLATSDAEAAERLRREIEARLGTKAYVTYQAPYYKVRIGNCPSSDGCRDLQARLRDAGYETVIVADSIEP